jgi:hypothetical protein
MLETTRRLVNNLRFGNNVDRSYDDQYKQAGAKVGDTVKARLPQRYLLTRGAGLVRQDVTDQTVDITITDQNHVGLDFSTWHLTLNVERYKQRYLDPAVDILVNAFDYDGMTRMYQETFHTVGTPAVTPGSTGTLPQAATETYLLGTTKLHDASVPEDDRRAVISPRMHMFLTNGVMTLFNPAMAIGKQYRTGQFASEALGVAKWFMVQNTAVHTVGPLGGTPTMSTTANQTGSVIATIGWTAAAALRLRKGDVIQITDVNAINPMNRQSTGQRADFVVTADTFSDGAGAANVPIYPAIIGPNQQFQTVDALPAASAPLFVFGGAASTHASKQTAQGLIFRKEAYVAVMADLEKPGGLWVSERISNAALGVSIRLLKDYTIDTDKSPARMDVAYGWKAVRPEMGCRVCA